MAIFIRENDFLPVCDVYTSKAKYIDKVKWIVLVDGKGTENGIESEKRFKVNLVGCVEIIERNDFCGDILLMV